MAASMPSANIAGVIKRIDLTTLQLFVAIYEEGNLTRASEREAIAPSAVSKRLHSLEETLKVSLFERMPQGMKLTSAGEALLHHARRTLLNIEKIAVELSEYADGVRGHVRMLSNLSAIIEFLPDDLPTFFSANATLRLDLQERPSADVVRGVEEGVADIGICSADVDTRTLQQYSYRKDNLVAVVPEHHPLAKRNRVEFSETLDFDHVALFATSSIYLRSQYTAQQVGKALKLRIHVPGFDAVCRMVQAGMGVGIIPDGAFDALSEGMHLQSIPLEDAWAKRQLSIVVRNAADLTSAGKLMFEHLSGSAAQHNAFGVIQTRTPIAARPLDLPRTFSDHVGH
jgi:DNA-binding transcriptional LysR family regulator